jgi:hypothetical protein
MSSRGRDLVRTVLISRQWLTLMPTSSAPRSSSSRSSRAEASYRTLLLSSATQTTSGETITIPKEPRPTWNRAVAATAARQRAVCHRSFRATWRACRGRRAQTRPSMFKSRVRGRVPPVAALRALCRARSRWQERASCSRCLRGAAPRRRVIRGYARSNASFRARAVVSPHWLPARTR